MAEVRIEVRTRRASHQLRKFMALHGQRDGPLHDRSVHRAEDQNMVHKTKDE